MQKRNKTGFLITTENSKWFERINSFNTIIDYCDENDCRNLQCHKVYLRYVCILINAHFRNTSSKTYCSLWSYVLKTETENNPNGRYQNKLLHGLYMASAFVTRALGVRIRNTPLKCGNSYVWIVSYIININLFVWWQYMKYIYYIIQCQICFIFLYYKSQLILRYRYNPYVLEMEYRLAAFLIQGSVSFL